MNVTRHNHLFAFRTVLIAFLLALLLSPVPQHVAIAGNPALASGDEGAAAFRGKAVGVELLFTACSRSDVAVVNAEYEQRVVELVNQRRAENGLPPLKRQVDLDYAARYHAKDMVDDNYFNHDSYDNQGGSQVKACTWSDRLEYFYNWNAAAENIAAGQSSPESVMNSWMNSSGHKANILSANYRELGVGFYSGGSYGRYWVQDFGSRPNVYPIIINSEAARTDNPQVSLYVYGLGVYNEMRLANDGGAWSAWQTFQPTLSWTLPGNKGVHTVQVELRKADGTITSSSDEIELTSGGAAGITLGNIPDSIGFIYVKADGRLTHNSASITPKDVQSGQPIAWTLNCDPHNWIVLNRASGSSPADSFTVSLQGIDYNTQTSLTGTITVTASGTGSIAGSPKVINVWVKVVDDLPYSQHLPVMSR